MSDNTGIYILENKDGYRVLWGSGVEYHFHQEINKTFYEFCKKLPRFNDVKDATNYAKVLDKANRTEYGIVILNNFKNMELNRLGKSH